jgi:MYXO-CTERM domain-containing protein
MHELCKGAGSPRLCRDAGAWCPSCKSGGCSAGGEVGGGLALFGLALAMAMRRRRR